jgi:hypothetical protein
MNEMENLEKAAISQDNNTPTIIDGRLEPRRGGFDSLHSPVFGVIKTHHRNYLDDQARGVVYRLEIGQRTPTFRLKEGDSFSVISWYLRLSGTPRTMPTYGLVRIEVSQA